jgi:hypothetical protein
MLASALIVCLFGALAGLMVPAVRRWMMRAQDPRELVHFPEPLLEHELANMRDHLLTLSRIQEYLSQHEFEKAVDLAEKRLGMSSFGLHGAHEVAPHMPKGMQEAGTAMHHAASRFAITAQNAAINDDVGHAHAFRPHFVTEVPIKIK